MSIAYNTYPAAAGIFQKKKWYVQRDIHCIMFMPVFLPAIAGFFLRIIVPVPCTCTGGNSCRFPLPSIARFIYKECAVPIDFHTYYYMSISLPKPFRTKFLKVFTAILTAGWSPPATNLPCLLLHASRRQLSFTAGPLKPYYMGTLYLLNLVVGIRWLSGPAEAISYRYSVAVLSSILYAPL